MILPIYRQSKISTVPEYMELRYDRRSRLVFSGFTVFTGMLIDTAGAMFAGAIVLHRVPPACRSWSTSARSRCSVGATSSWAA